MDGFPDLTRRRLFGLGASAAAGLLAGCSGTSSEPATPPAPTSTPAALTVEQPKPREAWLRLAVGNDRFAGGKAAHPRQTADRRKALVAGQRPFACVLGCVDSRVPPELIFDQGIGDLLTVRSAGEVLDEAVLGSVEYGVEHLEIPLVVVLGHVGCGAVQAAVDFVQGGRQPHGDVSSVVRMIEGAVRSTPSDSDADRFLTACVAEQVRRVGTELRERSYVVDTAFRAGRLQLRTMVYDLRSGRVSSSSDRHLLGG